MTYKHTINREEVWKWYLIVEDWKKSDLKQTQYCEKNNIPYRLFKNMYYRIEFRKRTDPREYERLLPIGREAMASPKSTAAFSRKVGIDRVVMNTVIMHLRWLDVIEEIKAEKGEQKEQIVEEIKFIQVTPKTNIDPVLQEQQEAEVIEPQNDIEISICKGVKVSIAPNIDAMKIIKIIELLKDL